MRWVGSSTVGVCWVVASSGMFVACGDDDSPEQSDGGTGGRSGGGSPTTGGSTGSSGGGGSGATAGKGGQTPTGGSGNTGGQTETGGTPPIDDGGRDSSAGGDASVNEPDGSVPDPSADSGSGGDGSDGSRGALCPRTSSWPAGTYSLNALVSEYYYHPRALAPFYVETSLSCMQRSLTLVVTAPPPTYECFGVSIDAVSAVGPVEFCGNVEEHDAFIRLAETFNCVLPVCQKYVDIDRQTGAVVELVYADSKSGFGDVHDFSLTATGWPRCAATEASPPAPPEPPKATSCAPIGCTRYVDLAESDPPPPCGTADPSRGGICTCEAASGETVTECCLLK